jgi:uncharacterized membrane protein YhaH (DUF805 family)
MAEVTTPVETGTAMPITKVWFSFTGRINRSTWWMKYLLPVMAISFGLSILDMILGTNFVFAEANAYNDYTDQTMGIISLIWLFPSIWIGFAAGAKRCHDRDKSGWWQLLWFLPVIGWIWMFVVLGFLRGTVGPNRFGADSVSE